MEVSTPEVSPLHIFSPSCDHQKSLFNKASNEKKVRPIMDLKTLINYVESNHSQGPASKPTSTKSFHLKVKVPSSAEPELIKPIPLTKSRFNISRPSSPSKKPMDTQLSSLSSKTADKPNLREKRLYNAQVYRNNLSNSVSGSLEKIPSLHKTTMSHFHIKPIFTRESSPVNKASRQKANLSVNTQGPTWQQEASTAFSIELHHVDSAISSKIDDDSKSPMSKSYSGTRHFKPKMERSSSKGQWTEYSEKVSEHVLQRYEQNKKIINNKYSATEHEKDDPEKFHDRVKSTYSKFIKKNFDDGLVERLDTFGNFAFTSVEREENREIPVFFNETKRAKETLGTMGIVDLWSQRQRTDLVKRANFTEEKKMIEKFSFYRVKDRKAPANAKRPQFVTLHRKNENVYKDILARKSYVDFVKKTKTLALMSPLERHLYLQGKQFHKSPKEGLGDSHLSSIKAQDIVGGLDHLIQDLDKFAEDNQGDYLKLLEFSTASKKVETRNEVQDKRLLQKLQRFME